MITPRFILCARSGPFFHDSDSESDSSQSTQTSATTTQIDRRVGISGNGNVTATEGGTVNVQSLDAKLALATLEKNAAVLDTALRAGTAVSQDAIASAGESARVASSVAVTLSQDAISSAEESARVASSVATRAIESNTATIDTTLRAGVTLSQASIDAAQEAARITASAIAQNSAAAIEAAQESARVAAAASAQSSAAAIASAQESGRVAASAILAGQERSLDTADRSIEASREVAIHTTDTSRELVLANNALTEKTRQGNQELVKLVADKLSTAVADERKNINAELIETTAKYGSFAAVGLALALGVTMAIRKNS